MLFAMRVILALVVLAAAPAVAADEDPTDVLIRLRDQVLAHSERIPNYTCVETIHRDRYESAINAPKTCDDLVARRKQPNFPLMVRLATSDRLRLDVALSGDGEIYSWAGAAKFDERDIDELIPDGAMGTGPFASLLLGVFQGRPPRFTYEGETILDHRIVYEYSYRVEREDSHYRVKAKTEWTITGYDAKLWVDPKTAELIRLDVRTDELEPATSLCQTNTTLDYTLVQLAGRDFLLPKTTRQRFIGREGSESENQVTFAKCREFKGESTVSFGERSAGPESRKAGAPPETAFPFGLPVSIDLTTAIDDNAAAGDQIEGRLAKPIRDAKGAVLLAEGAALGGRLMRVEIRHGKHPESVLSIRWETIEIGGERKAVILLPNRRVGGLKVLEGTLKQRGIQIELPPVSDERYGVYYFPGEHVAVYAGYRTEWVTAR
jgi:hypothetical protein